MIEDRRGRPAPVPLTTVETSFLEGSHNYRVLFGQPVGIATLEIAAGLTRRRYEFSPGSRFALDLWRRNRYGTIQWRCFVCEAARPDRACDAVRFVAPGAHVLLHTRGAAQSRLFLGWLAELEASGVDVLACRPETFEAAHFRLQGSRADVTPPRRLSNRL